MGSVFTLRHDPHNIVSMRCASLPIEDDEDEEPQRRWVGESSADVQSGTLKRYGSAHSLSAWSSSDRENTEYLMHKVKLGAARRPTPRLLNRQTLRFVVRQSEPTYWNKPWTRLRRFRPIHLFEQRNKYCRAVIRKLKKKVSELRKLGKKRTKPLKIKHETTMDEEYDYLGDELMALKEESLHIFNCNISDVEIHKRVKAHLDKSSEFFYNHLRKIDRWSDRKRKNLKKLRKMFFEYEAEMNSWIDSVIEIDKDELDTLLCTSKVLQNKYANLKKRLVKKIGNEKAGVSGTGGGPYQKVDYDGNDKTISEILGEKRLGLQCSEYDDNADSVASTSYDILEDNHFGGQFDNEQCRKLITLPGGSVVPMEQAVTEEELYDVFEDTVVIQDKTEPEKNLGHKWSGNTTPLLRTKRIECLMQKDEEPILPTKKRQRLDDQMSSWASEKVALAKLQEKAFIEQSQMKMKLMMEEGAARMAREERLARMQEKVELLKEKEVQIRIDMLLIEKAKLLEKK